MPEILSVQCKLSTKANTVHFFHNSGGLFFSFSNELLKQLKSLIVEPGDSPKALRLLAVSILRELSPTVAYNVRISNLSADLNWLPLVFPLILTQVC